MPLLIGNAFQVIGQQGCKRQNFKGALTYNCCSRRWDAVRNPEPVDKVIPHKLLPALKREDTVGDEARDLGGTLFPQRLRALQQRATTLNEVVDNDTVTAFGFALLDLDNPPVTIPDLGADDHGELMELGLEPLVGAVIWEGNCNLLPRSLPLELLKARLQQPHSGLQLHKHGVRKVELFLERVDVVNDHRCWAARAYGAGGEHPREGGRGGDLPDLLHALHGPCAEPRQDDAEVSCAQSWQGI
mmetsp:Transcript_139980/g.390233  ORF Transcript_139980/g.390233 Transcript_139980/m.390233 type:complete len:244 (+) Transcript_139980:69-800(+)